MRSELSDALLASEVAVWRYEADSRALVWLVPPVFLGLPNPSPSAQTLGDLIHTGDRKLLVGAARHSMLTGESLRARFRLSTPEGIRWLEAAGGRVDGDLTGSLIDVTTQMDVEDALLGAVREAETLLELAGAVAWEWRADGDDIVVRAFGPSPDALELTLHDAMSRVHPDDERTLRADWRELAVAGSGELRFRSVSRHVVRDIVTRVRVEHDDSGRITGACGIFVLPR